MAIIKPFKLDDVRDALSALGRRWHDGVRGQRLRSSKGADRDLSRRRIFSTNMLPKVKIEVAVSDDALASAWSKPSSRPRAAAQSATARSFVLDLGQAVRIRTGETGDTAL
jgi:nitrogen regulatory protein P-II 2